MAEPLTNPEEEEVVENPHGLTMPEPGVIQDLENVNLDGLNSAPPVAAAEVAKPNPLSAELISDMAGVVSSDEAQIKADIKEQDARNRAIGAALFGTKSIPQDTIDAIRSVADVPYTKRTNGEALTDLMVEELHKPGRVRLAEVLDVSQGRQVMEKSVEENLSLPVGSYNDSMKEPNVMAKDVAAHFSGKDGWEEVNSLNDLTEFLNPLGGEAEAGMDVEFLDMVGRISTGDFDNDEFNTQMESNYGEDWEWRWAGWLAKEAVIDTALLALAITAAPLAGLVGVGTALRKANFLGSVARTGVIALGGGASQAAQNVALDRDADFTQEVLLRAGGQGAVEALGFAARAGYKSYVKNKPMTEQQFRRAIHAKGDDVSAHAALTEAATEGTVKNYSKTSNTVANSLEDATLPIEVQQGIAAHLGVSVNRMKGLKTDIVLPILKDQNETLINLSQRMPSIMRTGGVYTRLNELRQVFFDEGLTVSLRSTDNNINMASMPRLTKAMTFLGIAEPGKLALQSASNWLTTKNFVNKQISGFTKMYKEVEKGLTKDERQLLASIVKEGDSEMKVFDFAATSPKETGQNIPLKVREAYAKFRYVNDLAYEVADAGKVAALKGSVFKRTDGKGFIELVKAQGKDKGLFAREFNTDTMKGIGEGKKIAKADYEPDLTTIIPYRTGHIPRSYRTHRYSVVVMDAKSKQVAFEATFDNNYQATKYLDERNTIIGNNKGSNEIAVKIYNKTDTGAGGLSLNKGSMDLLSSVDDATRKVFEQALKANDISDTSIRVLLRDSMKPTVTGGHSKARSIGVATTKEAQESRLKLAQSPKSSKAQDEYAKIIEGDTPMTKQGQLNYFSGVAHSAGYDNWRVFAMEDWAQRYRHMLEGKVTPDPLNPAIKNAFKKDPLLDAAQWRVDKAEALEYAKWMQRTVKDRDVFENAYDGAMIAVKDRFARKAADGSFSNRVFSNLMDRVPLAKDLEGQLRFVAAFPKLLSMNTAQVVVQGSQAVLGASAAFGFNPRLATGSMFKLGHITGLHAATRMGRRLKHNPNPGSATATYNDMIKSGYFADLSTTDTAFGMSHGLDPHVGRKMWERFKQFSATPFRMGEGINRSVAFVTVRDQIVYAIGQAEKKGFANLSDSMKKLATDFDGKAMTSADIGSHAFREAIVEKASIIALNMGKAGELQVMSGSGSVFLQFKQVLAKEISVMDSTALTLREKMAGAGGMIAVFGFGAVPLAADLMKLGDFMLWDKDEPVGRLKVTDAAAAFSRMMAEGIEKGTDGYFDRETIDRLFKHGGIAAATEGEIDFANRVALGNFISDTWDVQDGTDMVVSLAVLMDMKQAADKLGVGFSDIGKILNPLTYMDIHTKVSNGATFNEALADQFDSDDTIVKLISGDISIGAASLDLMREGGKVFAQAGSLSRMLDAAHKDIVAPEVYQSNPFAPNYYSTSGLRGLPVERTRLRDILFSIGITPGKIVESYSKDNTSRIYKEALKEFNKDLEKRFRNSLGAPQLQQRIARDAMDQIILLKRHLDENGIENQITSNAMRSVQTKLADIVLDIKIGGQ